MVWFEWVNFLKTAVASIIRATSLHTDSQDGRSIPTTISLMLIIAGIIVAAAEMQCSCRQDLYFRRGNAVACRLAAKTDRISANGVKLRIRPGPSKTY